MKQKKDIVRLNVCVFYSTDLQPLSQDESIYVLNSTRALLTTV